MGRHAPTGMERRQGAPCPHQKVTPKILSVCESDVTSYVESPKCSGSSDGVACCRVLPNSWLSVNATSSFPDCFGQSRRYDPAAIWSETEGGRRYVKTISCVWRGSMLQNAANTVLPKSLKTSTGPSTTLPPVRYRSFSMAPLTETSVAPSGTYRRTESR